MQRCDYGWIATRLRTLPKASFQSYVRDELPTALGKLWAQSYRVSCPRAEIVEVDLGSFSYLFDLATERNLAAFGVMQGKNRAARDRARMAGFPKREGAEYHRGHMIPHTGHGGTDINLFIQLGSVNVGPFRELEKLAVAAPGSFYFVRLLYPRTGRTDRPSAVEQGLVRPGDPPSLLTRCFMN